MHAAQSKVNGQYFYYVKQLSELDTPSLGQVIDYRINVDSLALNGSLDKIPRDDNQVDKYCSSASIIRTLSFTPLLFLANILLLKISLKNNL